MNNNTTNTNTELNTTENNNNIQEEIKKETQKIVISLHYDYIGAVANFISFLLGCLLGGLIVHYLVGVPWRFIIACCLGLFFIAIPVIIIESLHSNLKRLFGILRMSVTCNDDEIKEMASEIESKIEEDKNK